MYPVLSLAFPDADGYSSHDMIKMDRKCSSHIIPQTIGFQIPIMLGSAIPHSMLSLSTTDTPSRSPLVEERSLSMETTLSSLAKTSIAFLIISDAWYLFPFSTTGNAELSYFIVLSLSAAFLSLLVPENSLFQHQHLCSLCLCSYSLPCRQSAVSVHCHSGY